MGAYWNWIDRLTASHTRLRLVNWHIISVQWSSQEPWVPPWCKILCINILIKFHVDNLSTLHSSNPNKFRVASNHIGLTNTTPQVTKVMRHYTVNTSHVHVCNLDIDLTSKPFSTSHVHAWPANPYHISCSCLTSKSLPYLMFMLDQQILTISHVHTWLAHPNHFSGSYLTSTSLPYLRFILDQQILTICHVHTWLAHPNHISCSCLTSKSLPHLMFMLDQ